MREDIFGGLKNALERGESIEQAIYSFTSAGYDEREVREAANQIAPGALSVASQTISKTTPSNPKFKPLNSSSKVIRSKRNTHITLLIIVLVILLIILGLTIFFRKDIVQFLTNIF